MLKKTILLAATMFGLIACGGDEEAATDGDKGDKGGDKAGDKAGSKGADGAGGEKAAE